MKIIFWLRSPQHEELYQRVTALGNLGTTEVEAFVLTEGGE